MPAREVCTALRLTKSYRRIAYSSLEIYEPREAPSTSSTSSELKDAYSAFALPSVPNQVTLPRSFYWTRKVPTMVLGV